METLMSKCYLLSKVCEGAEFKYRHSKVMIFDPTSTCRATVRLVQFIEENTLSIKTAKIIC